MRVDGFLSHELGRAQSEAQQLEARGYDGAFSAEGPHEPFAPLLVAAEGTSRLELMTNIAVAFARSPLDLAQQANDLQLASRGRFVLGVGSQIRPHIEKRYSMPWSQPAERMRELVSAIKAIQGCWQSGDPLAFQGQFYRHTLMTPFFSPGPNPYGPPPVFVAALGPRMTRVAAEVGDGLLIHPFHSGRFVREHADPCVDAGLQTSGRDRSQFTFATTAILCTGTTSAERTVADTGVRRLLSFYGSTPAYRVVLEVHGWGELQTELNRLSKEGRWEEMAQRIPDEVVAELTIRADPDDVGACLRDRYAGLVDRISFSTPYAIAPETMGRVLASVSATDTRSR